VPIYIMGGVLEVAKLVTASWLYQNWKNIPFLLKTYLTTAVFVLMIITSLGIFGFLSKAHIEQATPAANIVAEISNFEERILREETKITNLTAKIDRLNSGETVGADDQLVREQAIIENAQNKIVSSVELIQTQISNTQQQITDIQTDADKKIALIKEDVPSKIEAEQNKLKQLDDAVSAILNSNKAFFNEEKAASELRATQKPERDAIANNINKIQSTADNEVKDTQTATTKQIDPLRAKIDGFNSEISALQASINQEVLLAKQRINEINQKAIDQGEDSAELVKQYELDINTAYDVIDQYNGDKFVLEAQIRELSAEVGPIKYIAQFFDRDGDVDL
jgi:oligoendopeptidase F